MDVVYLKFLKNRIPIDIRLMGYGRRRKKVWEPNDCHCNRYGECDCSNCYVCDNCWKPSDCHCTTRGECDCVNCYVCDDCDDYDYDCNCDCDCDCDVDCYDCEDDCLDCDWDYDCYDVC